jgi:hypothetical protein
LVAELLFEHVSAGSNASLIDFVTERVKVTLRSAPTATIVSVSQNGECSCRPLASPTTKMKLHGD